MPESLRVKMVISAETGEAIASVQGFGSALDDVWDRGGGPATAPRVFFGSLTQWRRDDKGRAVGLDYPAARLVCDGLGVRWRKVFGGLQVMEMAALDALGGGK